MRLGLQVGWAGWGLPLPAGWAGWQAGWLAGMRACVFLSVWSPCPCINLDDPDRPSWVLPLQETRAGEQRANMQCVGVVLSAFPVWAARVLALVRCRGGTACLQGVRRGHAALLVCEL